MYTIHAIQRTQERTGRSEESSKDFLSRAIDHGKLLCELPETQQAYLDDIIKPGTTAVIYKGYIVIVGDCGVAVTMFREPEWFSNVRKPHRPRMRSNEPVRSIKKWQRMRGIR